MELKEARAMALELMEKHGLPWNFEFDDARNRFGSCDGYNEVITLSIHLVRLNTAERVKQTILHEIAHGLVGGIHGHDEVWRAKAIELGDDGKRCFSAEDTVLAKPKHTYLYRCPECGAEIKINYRMHRKRACGRCCNRYSNGKYDVKYAFGYIREVFNEFETVGIE